MKFEYAVQETPRGLADAFIVGEKFIGNDSCALVLGDNVFYGRGFTGTLMDAMKTIEIEKGAVIFGYYVKDPTAYGVVEFDEKGKAISIEEKPKNPKIKLCCAGFIFL